MAVKKPPKTPPGPIVPVDYAVSRPRGMNPSPFGADSPRSFTPPPSIARPRNGADPQDGFGINHFRDRSAGGKTARPYQSNEVPED